MTTSKIVSVIALVAVVGIGAACQGGGFSNLPSRGQNAGPRVVLSDADLQGVDQYFSSGAGGANTQWILGDNVEIVASREYFSNLLSLNRGNFVNRTTRIDGDDTVETLRFLGAPNQRSAMTSPRAQVGTGVTVTARETLIVRLTRAESADRPVRIKITANGNASRGHAEKVQHRGPMLAMGGNLIRQGDTWVWMPIGG